MAVQQQRSRGWLPPVINKVSGYRTFRPGPAEATCATLAVPVSSRADARRGWELPGTLARIEGGLISWSALMSSRTASIRAR